MEKYEYVQLAEFSGGVLRKKNKKRLPDLQPRSSD